MTMMIYKPGMTFAKPRRRKGRFALTANGERYGRQGKLLPTHAVGLIPCPFLMDDPAKARAMQYEDGKLGVCQMRGEADDRRPYLIVYQPLPDRTITVGLLETRCPIDDEPCSCKGRCNLTYGVVNHGVSDRTINDDYLEALSRNG